MRLTLALFGVTIVDLHVRDVDPAEDGNRDAEPWPFGYTSGGQQLAHTELAGQQAEPFTEPYDHAPR